MTKYALFSYIYITTALVKLPVFRCTFFGHVKLRSAERSAWEHEACYKSECCSTICRLNKIDSVSFVC